jgi:uncharacterized protein (TIGR00369 family)
MPETGRATGGITDSTLLDERIRRGPYHQWLGLRVVDASEGEIVIEVPWRPEFIVNPDAGYMHGGILATVVDLAADWALATKLGRPFPTIDLRVDYHRPAMEGTLRATGRIVRLGSAFSTCDATIHDANEKLLASGRGTYSTRQK